MVEVVVVMGLVAVQRTGGLEWNGGMVGWWDKEEGIAKPSSLSICMYVFMCL